MRERNIKSLFWFCVGFLAVAIGVGIAYAEEDFKVEIRPRMTIYGDDDLDRGQGIEGRFYWKDAFLWGSYDHSFLRLYGQRAGDIDVYGAGLGMKRQITKDINVWMAGGWYYPQAELSKYHDKDGGYGEGIYYVMKNFEKGWGITCIPDNAPLEYKIQGNWGGSGGIDIKSKIRPNLFINTNIGYRFLQLKEFYRHGERRGLEVQAKEKRDFSGAIIGISLMYEF